MADAIQECALPRLSYAEFRTVWNAMTEEERERVRAKSAWEHESNWAVLIDWPDLIPERLRTQTPALAADEKRT